MERELARATSPWPELRVAETDEAITLTVELPGVAPDALDVQVKGRSLAILAKATTTAPEGYAVRRRERADYTFSRELTIPPTVDTSAIAAKLEVTAAKDGWTLVPLEPIEAKFAAFGWASVRVNGHDFDAMERGFARLPSATCCLSR